MAIKEIRSSLKQILALARTQINANGTTNGGIIDTAKYELGLMFAVIVDTFTSGDVNFAIQASDDPTFATGVVTYTDSDDEIIGSLVGIAATANTSQVDDVNNLDAANYFMKTVGLISSPRYVRIQVIGSNSPDAFVTVVATEKGEVLPTVGV